MKKGSARWRLCSWEVVGRSPRSLLQAQQEAVRPQQQPQRHTTKHKETQGNLPPKRGGAVVTGLLSLQSRERNSEATEQAFLLFLSL